MTAVRDHVGAALLACLLVPCAVRPAWASPAAGSTDPAPADTALADPAPADTALAASAPEASSPAELGAATSKPELELPASPSSKLTLDSVGAWSYAPPLGATASFGAPKVLLPRLQLPPLSLAREPWRNSSLSPADPTAPRPAPANDSELVDDRSGWAKWNESLAGVTSTVIGFDLFCLGAFTLLPNEWTGWEDPEFKGLKENFTIGPRVDNDRWAWNYIAHPITGAEYYLLPRNRGYSWYASFGYSAAMSTFWEYFVESAYEQASWQDIFITPVAGAALGELRWQVKKALVNPSTGRPVGPLKKVLYVLIDPVDALTKL